MKLLISIKLYLNCSASSERGDKRWSWTSLPSFFSFLKIRYIQHHKYVLGYVPARHCHRDAINESACTCRKISGIILPFLGIISITFRTKAFANIRQPNQHEMPLKTINKEEKSMVPYSKEAIQHEWLYV